MLFILGTSSLVGAPAKQLGVTFPSIGTSFRVLKVLGNLDESDMGNVPRGCSWFDDPRLANRYKRYFIGGHNSYRHYTT